MDVKLRARLHFKHTVLNVSRAFRIIITVQCRKIVVLFTGLHSKKKQVKTSLLTFCNRLVINKPIFGCVRGSHGLRELVESKSFTSCQQT